MNLESREIFDDFYETSPRSNSKDITKVVIGALAGAAVGSLVAGAFTERGVEIRNRVSERSKDITNNLKQKVSDIRDTVADKIEAAKDGAVNLIEKGKHKIGISPKNEYEVNSIYAAGNYPVDGAESKGTGRKIILGALIAAVAGTVVWSFATEKGKDTRKRIATGGKNLGSTLKEKASQLKEVLADTYKAGKEGAEDLAAFEEFKQRREQQNTYTSQGNGMFTGITGDQAV